MNQYYVEELERAIENILDCFDGDVSRENRITETASGELVEVGSELQEALSFAQDLVYHDTGEE